MADTLFGETMSGLHDYKFSFSFCDLRTPYLDYRSSPLGSILSQANQLTLMPPLIPIHDKTLPPTSLPKLIISFGILE